VSPFVKENLEEDFEETNEKFEGGRGHSRKNGRQNKTLDQSGISVNRELSV
jgi:hypothetical protein